MNLLHRLCPSDSTNDFPTRKPSTCFSTDTQPTYPPPTCTPWATSYSPRASGVGSAGRECLTSSPYPCPSHSSLESQGLGNCFRGSTPPSSVTGMNQGYFRHDPAVGWLLLLFSRIPPLGLTLRSEFNVSPLDPKAVVFMDPEYWVPGQWDKCPEM